MMNYKNKTTHKNEQINMEKKNKDLNKLCKTKKYILKEKKNKIQMYKGGVNNLFEEKKYHEHLKLV